eukprot:CAMPEP_0194191200 /NCGR_PEP_ID=MMETSP0154-20130528/65912_1 /TAXON_ID=1049557 /ORGANISM="Thalassiothrix antarctica, Strain L6-D1" /LENGTH=386 /DNA_ID=CAMNT_0038913693 /DNA_START=20 /DNA_END=1181 /DNA_ORIENTATION=+
MKRPRDLSEEDDPNNKKKDSNDDDDDAKVSLDGDDEEDDDNDELDEEDNVDDEFSDDSNNDEPVQCFDNSVVNYVDDDIGRGVNNNNINNLYEDVLRLWDNYGGSRKSAKSFWLSYSSKPRCLLEATALQIGKFHLGNDYEFAGVEFWAQNRRCRSSDGEGDMGLGFHFDKDEYAAREQNLWKHPVVATATYLTNEGAPLVVFDTHSADDAGNSDDDDDDDAVVVKGEATTTNQNDDSLALFGPPHAWIIYPSKGRHVAFSGDMLHGVAAELMIANEKDNSSNNNNSSSQQQQHRRLSFLVNIWLEEKPMETHQLTDEEIKNTFLNTNTIKGAFQLEGEECRAESNTPSTVFEVSPTTTKTKLIKLKEHLAGDMNPLPSPDEYYKA